MESLLTIWPMTRSANPVLVMKPNCELAAGGNNGSNTKVFAVKMGASIGANVYVNVPWPSSEDGAFPSKVRV